VRSAAPLCNGETPRDRTVTEMRVFAALALSGLLLTSGCSAGGSSPEMRTTVDGILLVGLPSPALRRCRAGPLVGPACPTLIPDSRWRERPGWKAQRGTFPLAAGAFELSAGAEHPGRPCQDRPPRLVHLLVLGGRAASAFELERPPNGDAGHVRDGLYARPRRTALLLGQPVWDGRRGELVLAPPFEQGGGIVGNHLIFRWGDGVDRAVTLHGWEPFSETVAVLRAVVESIPS